MKDGKISYFIKRSFLCSVAKVFSMTFRHATEKSIMKIFE